MDAYDWLMWANHEGDQEAYHWASVALNMKAPGEEGAKGLPPHVRPPDTWEEANFAAQQWAAWYDK